MFVEGNALSPKRWYIRTTADALSAHALGQDQKVEHDPIGNKKMNERKISLTQIPLRFLLRYPFELSITYELVKKKCRNVFFKTMYLFPVKLYREPSGSLTY